MAPIKTRTAIYATPTHKRAPPKYNVLVKSVTKAKSVDRGLNEKDNLDNTVGVYLRLRPLKLDDPTISKLDDQQVKASPPDGSTHQIYSFTQVFDNAPQSSLFDKVARPVAEDFITSGKNGLIFTYGITGSGKTYTMEGLRSDPGLIYRTIDFLFNSIGDQQTPRGVIEGDNHNNYFIRDQGHLYPNLAPEPPAVTPSLVKWQNRSKETSSVSPDPTKHYCLFLSLIELYNKQVHDLFEDFDAHVFEKEKKKREIRSDKRGISYVAYANEIEVKSADEAVELYNRGIKRRKTGSTALNQESSRGHCVLNLKLVQVRKTFNDTYDEDSLLTSQMCLVDLAGSERAKRSGATGEALHEACNINNSLGALRKCIRALRDREPTGNIQYREYSLTRLFKSYFEGHGSVVMVLCVKPTSEDFFENNIAMEFGLLTKDVAIDYASPPKMLKRSKSRAQDLQNFADMYDYMDKKHAPIEVNPDLSPKEFFTAWIQLLKSNRERKRKLSETVLGAQNEVRQNILASMKENEVLKQKNETRLRDIRSRDDQLKTLKSELNTRERSKDGLERQLEDLKLENQSHRRQIDKLMRERREFVQQAQNDKKLVEALMSRLAKEDDIHENDRRIVQLLKKRPSDWTNAAPSAPEMEPMQCSSPVGNPSTSETSGSNTPPATTATTSSTEIMEFAPSRPSLKSVIKTSPLKGVGVPVVNPKHNRSLSCSSIKWVHHCPEGTVDTGTVFKPKLKNGKAVKGVKLSHFSQDFSKYSLQHQEVYSNGELKSTVYKADILPTVCGGAQVIYNDIETMKQISPKRKRAASDAHYTH